MERKIERRFFVFELIVSELVLLILVIPGGGQTGRRHWFFARCTLTGRGIGLKFYDFPSNSLPGQKCN